MSQSVVRIEADGGQGSGVVVREDGMVLTAYHVVQGAAEITVEFSDGSKESAEMLGRDIGRDLAIVNIPRTGLAAVPFADTDELQIGQTLMKLGYGVGQRGAPAATQGVISALHEPTRISPAQVQTDSAVNAGDSGSPLITSDGRIAGIATSKLVSVQVEGVSFGSLIQDGSVVERMIGGETVCQPAPALVAAATDSGRTYRNAEWGWFAQLPSSFTPLLEDGVNLFYLSGAYQYPTDRRSRWPVDVIVYNPFLKSTYATAEGLLNAWTNYWRADEGLTVNTYGGVREVCRGSEIAWELDLTLIKPDSILGAAAGDGWVERDRLLVVDAGVAWFFLRVAAWPERFESRQDQFDTILYTFRFNQKPLSP